MSELLPCPFCGVVPAGVETLTGRILTTAEVHCKNVDCDADPWVSVARDTVDAAIAKAVSAWNTRAAIDDAMKEDGE